MVDSTLEDYFKNVINVLKMRDYTDEDISSSFEHITLLSQKQHKLFLAISYLSAVVVCVIISNLVMLQSYILSGFVKHIVAFCLFFLVSVLTYFNFANFHVKKWRMLISFLSISTIVSVISYFPHRAVKNLYLENMSALEQAANAGFGSGMMGIFAEPVSFLVLVLIIFFSFNLLPLIFFFIRD